MKTNKKLVTDLIFILDKSGSMSGLEKDTIGGFNSMLKNQKKLSDECYVSTLLFNHESYLLHNRIEIDKVEPLTRHDYQVSGCTALFDAVGMMIQKASSIQYNLFAPIEHKVLFVIITDGEENSSREYTGHAIKSLIEHRQAEFGWEFIFLGANIDAAQSAEDIGISRERAANFEADGHGTQYNYTVLDSVIQDFRIHSKISEDSLQEIRNEYDKRKMDK